jgi:hypothetical protein
MAAKMFKLDLLTPTSLFWTLEFLDLFILADSYSVSLAHHIWNENVALLL